MRSSTIKQFTEGNTQILIEQTLHRHYTDLPIGDKTNWSRLFLDQGRLRVNLWMNMKRNNSTGSGMISGMANASKIMKMMKKWFRDWWNVLRKAEIIYKDDNQIACRSDTWKKTPFCKLIIVLLIFLRHSGEPMKRNSVFWGLRERKVLE